MVSPDLFITAILGLFGVCTAGAGFLYRRDESQQGDIDANSEAISEVDRGFVQLTTRLFGHPDDETHQGMVGSREERVTRAEENIDSLSHEVNEAKQAAEDNGEAIEGLDDRMTEHATKTHRSLQRIEDHLGQDVVPDDDGFITDGGEE